MKIQRILPTLLFICVYLLSAAQSQLDVSKFDKQLRMDVANPNLSIHFPTGLIYEDTDGNSFANLSDHLLRIADQPYGYQIQTENVVFSELTKNTFSINHYDTPFDNVILLGPQQRAYWGPRDPVSPFYYDLKNFGDIYTVDLANRRMTELTENLDRGALRFYRYSNGLIYSHTLTIDAFGNPVWLAVSDRRAKENIKNSNSVLPRLVQLQLKDYNYKGVEEQTTGYIAQEVQKVFPNLVSEMDDGKLGVNYMGFSPLAVQAIKEQQDIIADLETRLKRVETLLAEK
jgi:hypothetical protein